MTRTLLIKTLDMTGMVEEMNTGMHNMVMKEKTSKHIKITKQHN